VQRVQAVAVLGRAGDPVEGGCDPDGQDEVVVLHPAAVRELRHPCLGIHRSQLAVPEPGAVLVGEAAQRVRHVARGQPGRGHLVQQRLERAVHVAVDQQHLGSGPVQLLHRGHAAKSGPDDDHPRSVTSCLPVRAPPHSCHLDPRSLC